MSEPDLVLSAALGAWLALRRLDRGRVSLHHGIFLDAGRPVPGYLVAPFRRLLDRGHARVDTPRVHLTESGRAVYRDLSHARGLWLATDRGVPFGTAAAYLLANDEGIDDAG